MPEITILIEENKPELFSDIKSAMDRIIREVSNDERPHPIIFEAEVKGVGKMIVGTKTEFGVLLQVSAPDGEPPYMASVNPSHKSTTDCIEYLLFGAHHTEILARYAIPMERAIKVIEYFLECGRLSDRVMWEEI